MEKTAWKHTENKPVKGRGTAVLSPIPLSLIVKDHTFVWYDQNPTDDRHTALVSPAFKALESPEGWVCLYQLSKKKTMRVLS